MATVSLALLKKHVRADDFTEDDDYLQGLLDAAEAHVIAATNRPASELFALGPNRGSLPTAQGIEALGSGLERWNILNSATIASREDMRAAINSVLFSKAYTLLRNVWYSDFVGGNITVDTPAGSEAMSARLTRYRDLYEHRRKDDPQTWLTTHSCVYDLLNKTIYASVQENDTEHVFSLSGGSDTAAANEIFDSLVKVAAFLYEIDYATIDYEYANRYFEGKAPVAPGACSAIRQGNYVGRNLDWLNDYEAVFAIRTPNADGRNAVVGLGGSLASLTIQKVDSGEITDDYKILPFYLQDGVNEHGLFAEMNVVPAKGNTQTVPQISKQDRVCALMLVRYILDRFDTVDNAVAYLRDYTEIFIPTGLMEMGYELHYLLADGTKTVVLEIIDNSVRVIESDKATNFHLYGVEFNEDGGVPTNADVLQALPSQLQQAVIMLAGHWYNQREAVSGVQMAEVPYTLQALIKPFRKLAND